MSRQFGSTQNGIDVQSKMVYTLYGKVNRAVIATNLRNGLTAPEKVMELREALTQISEIRQRVAQSEVFRGYRAVPVAFSGLLALATALVQMFCLPQPEANIGGYLALWIGAAVISMTATGLEIFVHHRHACSPLARQLTWLALRQFAPCLVA